APVLPRVDGGGAGRGRLRGARGPGGVQEVRISVVVPVFNEEANLVEFLRRTTAVLDARGEPYEVILVADGSRDGSLSMLKAWAQGRPEGRGVLELSRNIG